MEKNINGFENFKNNLDKNLFSPVISLLIRFMLDKKYFLHYHNSKRYLDGPT